MRLFIAVKIDNDKLDQFADQLQKEIDEELSATLKKNGIEEKARIKKTDEFHITLKFIGEIDERELADLVDGFKNMKLNKFSISLKNLGVFHNEKKDKKNSIIHLDFHDSNVMNEMVSKINIMIENKLGEKVGEDKNSDGFVTHITLNRVKYTMTIKKDISASRKAIDSAIDKINKKYSELFKYHVFNIRKIELIESSPVKDGVKYRTLCTNYL